MIFEYIWDLVYQPQRAWRRIRRQNYTLIHCYTAQLIWLALILPVSFFIGSTQMGWSHGGSAYHTLTIDSALSVAIAMYISILLGVAGLAAGIYWMEKTYGSRSSFDTCMVLATFVASPVLIAGVVALLPILWLGVGVMMAAATMSCYLMFIGVPVMMNVSEERGFFFSVSIVTVGLCVLVGLIITSTVLSATFLPLVIA